MVKMIYCITRKEGMSFQDFQRHWRETHGPIAARIPGVRRYIQSHTLPRMYESKNPPAYDGVAELWFDTFEALQQAIASQEVKDAREDELKFIDHSRSVLIITEEKPVIE
jgi:uncharacterized protein (TIGR02118 family)